MLIMLIRTMVEVLIAYFVTYDWSYYYCPSLPLTQPFLVSDSYSVILTQSFLLSHPYLVILSQSSLLRHSYLVILTKSEDRELTSSAFTLTQSSLLSPPYLVIRRTRVN